mgnify:CR=1 FL=1
MTLKAALLAIFVALGACTPLRAERPLFSPADQIGPPPLVEGVWIAISEDCPERYARRRGRAPAKCRPAEITRMEDGAWLYRFQDHVPLGDENSEAEMPRSWRLVIAPLTERHMPEDVYAPLYLAEYAPLDAGVEAADPHYALIAPVEVLPAEEIYVRREINCASVLRDGPIEGVREIRNERGDPTDCVAETQAAVREAVRRDLIENLHNMLGGEGRLMRVRP